MAYNWDWGVLWQFRWALFKGFLITIELSFLVILAGTILALIFTFLRKVDHPLIIYPTKVVIEALKDLPILVILIWLYFVLPIAGIKLSGFVAAFIGLSLSLGAFASEAIRSGIESIPRGQLDSAIALGYSKRQAMFKVILPQTFKQILPNLMGLYIHQIKNTALASMIAVNELLHIGNIIISSSYRPLEVYTAIAMIYLIIIVPLVIVSHYIEKRLGVKVKTL